MDNKAEGVQSPEILKAFAEYDRQVREGKLTG